MADELIFEGIPETEAKFNALALVAQRQVLTRAARAGAELVRESAAKKAPRDTGRLSRSIIISAPTREQTIDESSVRVGPSKDAWYGRFVEVGTRFSRAEPYLAPAYDENIEQAIERAREVLKQEVDRLTK